MDIQSNYMLIKYLHPLVNEQQVIPDFPFYLFQSTVSSYCHEVYYPHTSWVFPNDIGAKG